MFIRRYEAELKKENKTDEYRALAQREIRSIETALPVLQYVFIYIYLEKKLIFILFREEDEYKAQLKTAEDAQQAATIKRKVYLISVFKLKKIHICVFVYSFSETGRKSK